MIMIRKSCIFLNQPLHFFILTITAIMLSVSVPSVSAEEKPDADSGWEFQVAPYMWFLSLDGDVTVKGQKSDLDFDFSDIWDELNIAGMLTFDRTFSTPNTRISSIFLYCFQNRNYLEQLLTSPRFNKGMRVNL